MPFSIAAIPCAAMPPATWRVAARRFDRTFSKGSGSRPVTSSPIHSITCVMPMLRSSRYSDQPTIDLPSGVVPSVLTLTKQKSRNPAPQRRVSTPVMIIDSANCRAAGAACAAAMVAEVPGGAPPGRAAPAGYPAVVHFVSEIKPNKRYLFYKRARIENLENLDHCTFR
jgi:hypothetical protein